MNPVIDSDGFHFCVNVHSTLDLNYPLFENLVVIDKFRGSELLNINFQYHECVFISYGT